MRGRSSRAPVGVGACLGLVLALAPALSAGATSLAVSPATKKLPAKAGTGTLVVKVQSDQASVEVSVAEAAEWISFTETTKTVPISKGKGTARFSYVVTANETSVDRAVEEVAVTAPGAEGKTWAVSQASVPCVPKISATKASVGFVGGEGSFDVDAPAGCPWTISSGGLAWIGIETLEGTGGGMVAFTVDVNGGNARTGKITLAARNPNTGKPGAKKTFTVAQAKRDKPTPLPIGDFTEVTTPEEATTAFCGSDAMFGEVFGPGGLSALLGDFGGIPGGGFRVSGAASSDPAPHRLLRAALGRLGPAVKGAARVQSTATDTQVEPCDNYTGGFPAAPGTAGTMTTTMSAGGKSGTLTIESNACRSGDELASGTISVNVKVNDAWVISGTGKLGTATEPFLVTTYDGDTALSLAHMALGVKISNGNLDMTQYKIVADGYVDETDLVTNGRQTLVDLASFSLEFAQDWSGGTATTNGAIRMVELADGGLVSSQELTFSNLHATITGDPAGADFIAAVRGIFAIRTVPAEGPQGTFDFATPDPLHVVGGDIVSGTVTVNGATIVRTGPDTADVSYSGGDPRPINIGESCTL